jgi:hypothetical protein
MVPTPDKNSAILPFFWKKTQLKQDETVQFSGLLVIRFWAPSISMPA